MKTIQRPGGIWVPSGERAIMARILIQFDKCLYRPKGCTRCIDECPMKLLKFEFQPGIGDVILDDNMCIECRNCEVTCPKKCIQVKIDE